MTRACFSCSFPETRRGGPTGRLEATSKVDLALSSPMVQYPVGDRDSLERRDFSMATRYTHEPEFSKLLAGVEDDIDLIRLLLEFSAAANPRVDREACHAELDRLGRLAAAEIPASAPLASTLIALSRLLYNQEGFHGNRDDYYDPRNCYLQDVLARRTGLPITLGIIYMEIASRIGRRMYGVGLPLQFMVGCDARKRGPLYVDPFTDGDVLERSDCQERVEDLLGQRGVLTDEHFRPASTKEIATRVLRNLKGAFARRDEWNELLAVQERIVTLLPQARDEQRDLSLILLRMGQAGRALPILEDLNRHSDPAAADELAPYLRSARRMMAELN